MAKVADVFGRFEAFCVSILIYVLGYIQMAASTNVQTYASAQIFYSAGSTGLQILQQVFIADSSNLLNRAFLALLPEFPFLVTVWIGPTIADAVLKHASWRWGYGMWSIILPASFLPLALSLLLNQRKARRLNLIKLKSRPRGGVFAVLRRTWYDLDMGGLILLSAAVTLILVPLTLAANSKNGWKSDSIVAMIVVGLFCLIALPFWESSKRLAPKPLLSLHLLKQRTALAGCTLAFWYFSEYLLFSSARLPRTFADASQWRFISLFNHTFIPISRLSKATTSLPLAGLLKHLPSLRQLPPLRFRY